MFCKIKNNKMCRQQLLEPTQHFTTISCLFEEADFSSAATSERGSPSASAFYDNLSALFTVDVESYW